MRHLTRTLAALAFLCLALIWLGAAQAATPLLGLYEGASCNIGAQNAPARNALGRVEDLDTVFIDYSQTPEFAYTNVDWAAGCYRGQVANLALSVPLAFTRASAGPYGLTAGAYTLEDVAAGKLDAVFAHIAHSAVSHGFPAAHMRLGWEMNGGWYLWAAHGREASFNAAFCHVKAVMQAAEPTARFTYWLNPSVDADASYQHPDACMDASTGVAWDQYENSYTANAATSEPAAWNASLNGWWGIKSITSWYGAARHAVPEAGVGLMSSPTSATADDETFAADLIAEDAAAGAEFVGWWDSDASYGGRWSDGSKPGVALEMLKEWGAAPLPAVLAGASLYTGPAYKAAGPSGYHAFLAQLANGHVEQLAWGDQPGQTIQATDLSKATSPPATTAPAAVTAAMTDIAYRQSGVPAAYMADLAQVQAYAAGKGTMAAARSAWSPMVQWAGWWAVPQVKADVGVIAAWLAAAS